MLVKGGDAVFVVSAVLKATRWCHCTTSCRWRCHWNTFLWQPLTISSQDVVESIPPA